MTPFKRMYIYCLVIMFTYTVTLHTLLATHLASFTLLFTEFPYGNPLLGNQNLKQS